ncbi:Cyanovirin-N [Ascodesmis nigricans]|uniref:Cyanovirin-N n=1 Tax=Ascodesmis nigricans TaxID=341454 RepID=A0A4S2MZK2_9PEZI|nr:Cyanovirin-N [Ascodesmis nigricans]
MSFHLSGENIRVRGAILKAQLRNMGGELVDAEINLDEFIGNNDGNFEWGGENFSQSAENISFSIEGGGEVPVLRADLRDCEGNYHHRDINLSERVENIDGRFEFLHWVYRNVRLGLLLSIQYQ